MKRILQVVGTVGAVAATGLLTAGAASASTASEALAAPRANCSTGIRSGAVPIAWIPRSPAENDRRLTWQQVRRFDTDRDNRLSDREMSSFRGANRPIPQGGPRCDRPENPPRR